MSRWLDIAGQVLFLCVSLWTQTEPRSIIKQIETSLGPIRTSRKFVYLDKICASPMVYKCTADNFRSGPAK